MFDLTSSKLLILAVVALLVVGPEDLPALLRTVGRYLGMIRRQAEDFRRQFDEAMRESEIADLKKEMQDLGQETSDSLRKATDFIESDMSTLNRDIDQSLSAQTKVDEDAWNKAVLEMERKTDPEPDPGAVEVTSQEAPTPPVPASPRPITEPTSTAAEAGAEPSRGGA